MLRSLAWFSHQLSNVLAALGEELNDERVFEAYHDTAIVPHVRLGPDAQVTWPATSGKSTALFIGLRGRVAF
jgi:hypothetical protein